MPFSKPDTYSYIVATSDVRHLREMSPYLMEQPTEAVISMVQEILSGSHLSPDTIKFRAELEKLANPVFLESLFEGHALGLAYLGEILERTIDDQATMLRHTESLR
jgi:hypothetical protein